MHNTPKNVVTMIMPTTKNDKGGIIESMCYELAGVVDAKTVSCTENGIEKMMDFSMRGHPRVILGNRFFGNKSASGMVIGVIPDSGERNSPFGVFFATKESNPEIDRKLITRIDLCFYRDSFKAIYLNDEWSAWKNVVDYYA